MTIESTRGAIAFIDACRSARILQTMTAKEYEQLVPLQPDMQPAGFYFRAFNGKRNFAPPADLSDWYRLESMDLRNGDNVGVVTTWIHPGVKTNITPETTERILAEIDRGMEKGRRYSNANTAKKRGAFHAVQKHCPDKTEGECRRIITAWVKQGLLYEDEYNDPVDRDMRTGLFVRNTSDLVMNPEDRSSGASPGPAMPGSTPIG